MQRRKERLDFNNISTEKEQEARKCHFAVLVAAPSSRRREGWVRGLWRAPSGCGLQCPLPRRVRAPVKHGSPLPTPPESPRGFLSQKHSQGAEAVGQGVAETRQRESKAARGSGAAAHGASRPPNAQPRRGKAPRTRPEALRLRQAPRQAPSPSLFYPKLQEI